MKRDSDTQKMYFALYIMGYISAFKTVWGYAFKGGEDEEKEAEEQEQEQEEPPPVPKPRPSSSRSSNAAQAARYRSSPYLVPKVFGLGKGVAKAKKDEIVIDCG